MLTACRKMSVRQMRTLFPKPDRSVFFFIGLLTQVRQLIHRCVTLRESFRLRYQLLISRRSGVVHARATL